MIYSFFFHVIRIFCVTEDDYFRNKLKKSLPFLEIVGVNTCIDINERKKFVVSLKNVSPDIHVEVKDVFILWNKDSIVPAFRVPMTLKKSNL